MTCEIKNEKCPFQIQCLFRTAATNTQPFALYFHPSQGSPERVLFCGYNGLYRCFGNKGFKETHNGYNNVSITVPDTFAPREGFFACQKGDISMIKTCSYHPPEICDDISSTKSGIGLETTTKGNSPSIPVVQKLVPIAIVPIIIIIIGYLLYWKCRPKCFKECLINNGGSSVTLIREKRKKLCPCKETTDNDVEQSPGDRSTESLRDDMKRDNTPTVNGKVANVGQGHASTGNRTSGASSEIQPMLSSSQENITSEELEKSSLGKENTGNHVEQSPGDRSIESFMKFIRGSTSPINRDNTPTVNGEAANVGQGHASTGNRTSGASSEIQPTLPSSVSRTPSPGRDGSDKPPLISPFN